MKKFDKDAFEKMAKNKNIDKEKIETIANNYKGKSENEIINELVKIGRNLDGKEEVISKIKGFLNEKQAKKLDDVMNKISEAEINQKTPKKVKRVKKIKKG